MNDLSMLEGPVSETQCWRLSFERTPAEPPLAFTVIHEPLDCYAVAEQTDISDVLEEVVAENANSLLVVWMPRVARCNADNVGRIEAWARQGSHPLVRASTRTILALWSGGRAVIYSAPDDLQSALDAVARFTAAAQLTSDLEQQISASWNTVESHVSLTHALSDNSLKTQREINRMTEIATRMKVEHLRLQKAIRQTDIALDVNSKLLFAELALQAQLSDRLELLEHPVQFLLDHYELSNTRSIESRFNRRIMLLEIGIVLLIFADFIALLMELNK
jgi:hypothetical protein